MAAKLAEQRKREKQIERDLAQFLKAEDTIERARTRRDKAVARAEAQLEESISSVRAKRAAMLAQMNDRGQSASDLADLTGLSASEVRELLREHKANQDAEAETNAASAAPESAPSAAGGDSTAAS